MINIIEVLREHEVQPTPQRIAVAEFVLTTDTHPSADEVWAKVRDRCPTLSRATVYNTLHLFAEKGLLRTQPLREGVAAFDPHVEPHHHFIDEESGEILDVPWDAIRVAGEEALTDFEIRDVQVIFRGRRKRTE